MNQYVIIVIFRRKKCELIIERMNEQMKLYKENVTNGTVW